LRAVKRTLRILEIIARAKGGLKLADICELSDLDGSTVLRYLKTLTQLGYVTSDPGTRPRYHAGTRLLQMGDASYLTVIQKVARPYMESLRDACGEDVNLGTMDAGSALCVETQKSSHILNVNFSSGLRVPAYASSFGKAILAFAPPERLRALMSDDFQSFTPTTISSMAELDEELARIRLRGYATDNEEFTPGVVCIGAPIFGAEGRVVGALSITAPRQRISLAELEERYATGLLDACRSISRELGYEGELTGAADHNMS